uniref:Uncharacterized protein n=1 Tax=Fusarium oxysporum (strain Fo5176) TaxID=660025 RepID=A0A0D2XKT3_FUSOF
MGKSLTEDLTFKDPETLGNNFFTRHPVRWFMGPMKAVVTLAECVQGLGQFLELVPPRTIASTNYHATTYIEHPPSESVELQDTAKRVEMVLRIMRRGAVTTNLIEEGLLQLVRLDEGELNRAINDASQFLDNTTEVLLSTLDTVLGKGKAPVTIGTRSDEHEGEMSLDSINIAVDSLKSSIEQTGQLFKLADEETAAYKNTCKKWAGFTALSLIPIAIGCSIPGASVAATAARVVCIGGGAIPTAVCGYKTWKEWWSWDDSDQVRKLVAKVHQVFCCTWIFLTIDLWRRNGLSDDDERLLEFAKRMAEAFGINNLRNNWGSNDYATQLITKNRSLIAQDMRNIMDAVHKRRNIPRESQSAGEDSAHPVNPDHNVQQQTVVEINGQNLLQSSISSAESEPTLSELDSSSAISETDDSTAGLHGRLNEFLIPAPSESNGWGSVNGSDLDLSGSHTPTEVSNYWDD